MKFSKYFLFAILFVNASSLFAAINVEDDSGNMVQLKTAATRIVSLAPHITELLFEAGAGRKIVGVVQYSDYPPAATRIKQIGGYTKLDLEAIIVLQPDLVVAWKGGNNKTQLEKLRKFGLTIYYNEPRKIIDIATSLEKLGRLAGTSHVAKEAAQAFRNKYQQLKQTYQHRSAVRGFYQVWNQPLITVNGKHLISDVLRLCGVQNVFADLPLIAPRISVEAVLEQDPQMIIASGMDVERPEWLDDWRKWESYGQCEQKIFILYRRRLSSAMHHAYSMPPNRFANRRNWPENI